MSSSSRSDSARTLALPTVSVVVPAFNAAAELARCLDALERSSVSFELIVVDDASTDPAAVQVMRRAGAGYVRLERNSGPAVARNAGAKKASGSVVAFIDSDVVVTEGTIESLARVFAEEPAVDACFGSYDDQPDATTLVSTYRNLLHHHTHQTGPRDATTFWAGCGAIRREAFVALGGFDERYRRPSIEDIELGMRLFAAGHVIRLAPWIQVKHLKRWRFANLVRVDVASRAIPWTHLLIERPKKSGDLNLSRAQKLCMVLVFLALGAAPAAVVAIALGNSAWWLAAPPALLLPVLWMNRRFYRLLARVRGAPLLFTGTALHLLYYVYAGLAYLWAHATHEKGRDVV